MGVEVSGASFHWPQLLLPQNPTSRHTIALVFSFIRKEPFLSSHRKLTDHRSPFLGTSSPSFFTKKTRYQALRRWIKATFDDYFATNDEEEEFVNQLDESTKKFCPGDKAGTIPDSRSLGCINSGLSFSPPEWSEILPEFRPDHTLQKKANSVELPLSPRIIKRKKRGVTETRENPCCSMKKAFTSMVFIIEKLQSYAMQELRLADNLHGILNRVHGEMHASFVWLFQQIFSSTPTLMLSLMLLLANYTVSHTSAVMAATPPVSNPTVSVSEHHLNNHQRFKPSITKMVNPSITKTFTIGGGDGGGKQRPVAAAAEDGNRDPERIDNPSSYSSSTRTSTVANPTDHESSAAMTEKEETRLWNMIEEEARRLQSVWRDEALLDADTLKHLVAPVAVEIEPEDDTLYSQTELMYFEAISQDPNNPLLLCNFAHFLFIVLHQHERAEYYFKFALEKGGDAESLGRYANFLWVARKDVGAAEEKYLEAIAAEPENSYHAANYANFLWSTGGQDTCYPI